MSEIPSIFWMILFGALGAGLLAVFIYLVALLQELTKAVGDSRRLMSELEETIASTNEVMEEAKYVIQNVKDSTDQITETVNEFNTSIVQPVKQIGSVIGVIAGFVGKFKK